jgi:hypothetical protein
MSSSSSFSSMPSSSSSIPSSTSYAQVLQYGLPQQQPYFNPYNTLPPPQPNSNSFSLPNPNNRSNFSLQPNYSTTGQRYLPPVLVVRSTSFFYRS